MQDQGTFRTLSERETDTGSYARTMAETRAAKAAPRKSNLAVKIALGIGAMFATIGFAAGGVGGAVLLGLMFGAVALAFAKDFR